MRLTHIAAAAIVLVALAAAPLLAQNTNAGAGNVPAPPNTGAALSNQPSANFGANTSPSPVVPSAGTGFNASSKFGAEVNNQATPQGFSGQSVNPAPAAGPDAGASAGAQGFTAQYSGGANAAPTSDRYRFFNGYWWYWMPDNRWVIWVNGRWISYDEYSAMQNSMNAGPVYSEPTYSYGSDYGYYPSYGYSYGYSPYRSGYWGWGGWPYSTGYWGGRGWDGGHGGSWGGWDGGHGGSWGGHSGGGHGGHR